MFLQKANPHHDRRGRFTTGPSGGARAAASAATPYGGAYSPAKFSVLREDGTLDINACVVLHSQLDANTHNLPYNSGQDKRLIEGRQVQGFNGKPHIISNKDLESLPGETYHRGDEEPNFSEAIRSEKLYGGMGVRGNGTYSSTSFSEARSFAGEKGGMISFKLHPDAKVIGVTGKESISRRKLDDLRADISRKIQTAERNGDFSWDQSASLQSHFMDNGRLATALGYDAIVVGEWTSHLVVLNRTAMVVSDKNVTDWQNAL